MYVQIILLFLRSTSTSKTWKRTKVQFLWQNIEHGTYYARLFRDSKEHWKSLKTDVFSVAQAKRGRLSHRFSVLIYKSICRPGEEFRPEPNLDDRGAPIRIVARPLHLFVVQP